MQSPALLKEGFPNIRGTFVGVPRTRIIVFWGLYWGRLFWEIAKLDGTSDLQGNVASQSRNIPPTWTVMGLNKRFLLAIAALKIWNSAHKRILEDYQWGYHPSVCCPVWLAIVGHLWRFGEVLKHAGEKVISKSPDIELLNRQPQTLNPKPSSLPKVNHAPKS